ncbi:hypothetical protein TNCV_4804521 [Trichonephila clavipes]|nr:hypothetical protein TNCV_4804521 [Trichonephila clavipes]
MPDIGDNCLFEVERRLDVYLNSNKLEQLENQHAEKLFTCRNCGGGDRGRVAIYHPFGEFRRAKIALSPVWCSRPTTGVPLAHATMDFVGLDLTTSDRWHQKQQQQQHFLSEKIRQISAQQSIFGL